ncbi:MAG: GntR family transcriptional regulator [Defluviitaleaceae bacterium]|nr:GntR family transcriptional regulator [Defluviitaleaceae bacterium]
MNESTTPLYLQIYKRLRDDILANKYSAGKRLPTEKEICQTYYVSRITAKKALNQLAEENLIVRIKGKGSFVLGTYNQGTWVTERQKVLGLIMPDFEDTYGREIFFSIEKQCRKVGVQFIFSCSEGVQHLEAQALDDMLDFDVLGILIMPVHGVYYSTKILKLVLDGFPIVLIDRDLRGIPSHFVGTDNVAAAEVATDYLIQMGHKKICVYSPPYDKTSSLEDRINGIQQSIQKNNLGMGTFCFFSQLLYSLPQNRNHETFVKDKEAVKLHLAENPDITAAFALEYNSAVTIRAAAEELGLGVPDALSIICFDSPLKDYLFCTPPFTHMRQKQEEIGERAVDLVLSLAEGKTGNRIMKINLPTVFVPGRSTYNINDLSIFS